MALVEATGFVLHFVNRRTRHDNQDRGFYESNQSHYLRDDLHFEPPFFGTVLFLRRDRELSLLVESELNTDRSWNIFNSDLVSKSGQIDRFFSFRGPAFVGFYAGKEAIQS